MSKSPKNKMDRPESDGLLGAGKVQPEFMYEWQVVEDLGLVIDSHDEARLPAPVEKEKRFMRQQRKIFEQVGQMHSKRKKPRPDRKFHSSHFSCSGASVCI